MSKCHQHPLRHGQVTEDREAPLCSWVSPVDTEHPHVRGAARAVPGSYSGLAEPGWWTSYPEEVTPGLRRGGDTGDPGRHGLPGRSGLVLVPSVARTGPGRYRGSHFPTHDR